MRQRYIIVSSLIILLVFAFVGCTDKNQDNPTRPTVGEQGLIFQVEKDKYFSVFVSTSHYHGHLGIRFYTPPDYNWEGTGRYYPTLYMLTPFKADERYYFEHNLADVADRLINEGKIQPMIIVTIEGRSHLGGSFYSNSALQGKYFDALWYDYTDLVADYDIFGESVLTKIHKWVRAFDERDKRAISGVGMGGYGAMKSALETDLFSAVSAVNAPLDFDGTGSGGFLSMMNQVFPPGSDWILDNGRYGIDTVFLDNEGEPTIKASVEMWMMLSAAAAFSPQHLSFNVDSIYYDQFDVLSIATTVTESLTTDLRSYLPDYSVHMPFDSTGALNNNIWQLWMNNNIETLYRNVLSEKATYFERMPKLLVVSQGAEFSFGEQMDGFMEFMNDNALNYQVKSFKGNAVLTGTADHFLYDLLEDILIFHSEQFGE